MSCERIFRPSLNGLPVVGLSINDGCAVARLNEAKALGIRMGHPWFQMRLLEASHGVVALSANLALCDDISDRVASQVLTFTHTSPFRDEPQYSRSATTPLRRPSADTRAIVQAAVTGLRAIYKPGFKLAKAGVMLLGLMPDSISQGELDLEPDLHDKGKRMTAMDSLNHRLGKGTVLMGSAGLAG